MQTFELLRRLRTLLDARTPLEGDLRDAASLYREAAASAEHRARICADAIAKDRLTEAIHLADREPPLSEAIDALAFDRFPEFADLCRGEGIDPGAAPGREILPSLADARIREASTATLAKQFRKACLRREPAAKRLLILKHLCVADPQSALWIEQCRALEHVRLHEVEGILKAGDNQRDRAVLEPLRQELAPSDWLEEREARRLHSFVLERLEVIAAVRRRDEYARLAGEASEAQAAFDVERCGRIEGRWKELEREGPADLETTRRVEDAFRWLAAERRRADEISQFEASLRSMSGALEHAAPIEELRRLWHKAVSFDREIPDGITTRYRQLEALAEREAGRKHRLRIALGAIGTLALLAVAGVATSVVLDRRARAEWRDAIVAFEGAGRMEEAQKELDRLRTVAPAYLDDAAIHAAAARIETAMAEAHRRRGELGRVLDLIRKGSETGAAEDSIAALLRQADGLAQDPEDRRRTEELKHEVEISRVERKRKDADTFFRTVDGVRAGLAGLSALVAGGDLPGFDAKRASLTTDLATLRQLAAGDSKLEALLKDQEVELRGVEKRRDDLARVRAAEAKAWDEVIAAAARSPSDLKEALATFSRAHPSIARGADAAALLSQWAGVDAILAWRSAVGSDLDPLAFDVRGLAADRRHRLAKSIADARSGNADGVIARGLTALHATVDAYEEYASKPNERNRDILAEYLENDSVSKAYYVVHKDYGELYFVRKSDAPGLTAVGDTIQVELAYRIPGLADAGVRTRPFPVASFVESKPRVAPHAELAQRIVDRVKKSDNDWRFFALRAVEDIRVAKGAFPALRRLILDRLIEVMPRTLKSDPDLKPVVERAVSLRVQYEDMLQPWFDSFRKREAEQLGGALARELPEMAPIIDRFAKRDRLVAASVLRRIEYAGALTRDARGEWTLAQRPGAPTTAELWLSRHGGLVRIGRTDAGAAKWLAPESSLMREGAPVFAPADGLSSEEWAERAGALPKERLDGAGIWPALRPE